MKEALKAAIKAMENSNSISYEMMHAIADCKDALAQPEQEPMATMKMLHTYGDTTPPQRPWVGLTDDEMQALWDRYAHMEMMRAIEAKLKELNT